MLVSGKLKSYHVIPNSSPPRKFPPPIAPWRLVSLAPAAGKHLIGTCCFHIFFLVGHVLISSHPVELGVLKFMSKFIRNKKTTRWVWYVGFSIFPVSAAGCSKDLTPTPDGGGPSFWNSMTIGGASGRKIPLKDVPWMMFDVLGLLMVIIGLKYVEWPFL